MKGIVHERQATQLLIIIKVSRNIIKIHVEKVRRESVL